MQIIWETDDHIGLKELASVGWSVVAIIYAACYGGSVMHIYEPRDQRNVRVHVEGIVHAWCILTGG